MSECAICGPHYRHGTHTDDSYGSCAVCREYVPHTDDETVLVAFPCPTVRLAEIEAKRPAYEALVRAVIGCSRWDSLPKSIKAAAQPFLPTADDVRGIYADDRQRLGQSQPGK